MMKKLLLASALILVGCSSEHAPEPVQEETKISNVVTEPFELNESENPITKIDAENYVAMVQGAIEDVKKFDSAKDMGSFKSMLSRMTKLRDEGNAFNGTEFDNCGKLGIYPLDMLYMQKDNEDLNEKLGFYDQFYQSCKRQINQAN